MIEPNARAYNVNSMFNFTKCRFDISKLKCYIIKFRAPEFCDIYKHDYIYDFDKYQNESF